MARRQEPSMQRFEARRRHDEFLRRREAAARREEDHEEERSLYQLGRAHGLDHDVVLRGPGLVDEDFLLLGIPGRPHARVEHGLRCYELLPAAKAVMVAPLLPPAKMQNAAQPLHQ